MHIHVDDQVQQVSSNNPSEVVDRLVRGAVATFDMADKLNLVIPFKSCIVTKPHKLPKWTARELKTSFGRLVSYASSQRDCGIMYPVAKHRDLVIFEVRMQSDWQFQGKNAVSLRLPMSGCGQTADFMVRMPPDYHLRGRDATDCQSRGQNADKSLTSM